jgi:receptor protein-tyrosine kinase
MDSSHDEQVLTLSRPDQAEPSSGRVLRLWRRLLARPSAAPGHSRTTALSEGAARLAVRLRAAVSRSPSVVAFTGLAEREGVSTVAAEAAIALAQCSEHPVLLVDANLRAPSLHTRFEVKREPGLSDVVGKRAAIHEAVTGSALPSLFLLPAGTPVADGLATLSTAECRGVLRELRQQFGIVVVDCAPLGRFADAALLAAEAEGVVVVLAGGVHRKSELRRFTEELDAMGAKVLGVLLSERAGPAVP